MSRPASFAPAHDHSAAVRRGALAAGICYFAWGLVPLYWKQLAGINPVELIAHRHVWSLVFVVALVTMGVYLPRPVSALFVDVAASLGGR